MQVYDLLNTGKHTKLNTFQELMAVSLVWFLYTYNKHGSNTT